MLRYVLLSVAIFIALDVCAVAGAGAFGVVEDVEFLAGCDGVLQRYVVGLPEGFEGGRERDVCVALHGHGSGRWQFVRDGRDECRSTKSSGNQGGMRVLCGKLTAATSAAGSRRR